MAKAGFSGCIEVSPNAQTVTFDSRFINLSAIARATGLHQSYVSKIFAGKRTPSLATALRISAALGVSLDEFASKISAKIPLDSQA